MSHVIVTSYGIDSALSQILFCKVYPDSIAITSTREKIEKTLNNIKPDIVVGFDESVSNSSMVIPFSTDQSLTYKLAMILKIPNSNPKLMKYANLANKLKVYDESVDVFREYYTAVGHENFINEFKFSDTLSLTKSKTTMSKTYISILQSTCDELVENESSCEDGVAVCKNLFNGSLYLEDALIQKYYDESEPKSLLAMALWSIDGDNIRVVVKGKSGFGKKVCQLFSPEYRNTYDENSIFIPLSRLKNNIDNLCREMLVNKVNKIFNIEKRAYYDRFDQINARSNILVRGGSNAD